MTECLQLRAGDLTLDLSPAIGVAIMGLRCADVDRLRTTPEMAIAKGLVRQTSCYPLLPDAINRLDRPDHGLRPLAPGEMLSASVDIGVERS